MSLKNPLWGAPRIHGELLKLGFAVAQSTIAKFMAWRSGELARSCPRGALLFTASLTAQDPWRQKLIAAVFDDFEPFARKPSG
jgi:hypothetical protein